ncbi:type II toxin-antitoxin system HicB family antitoxin [uncultured Methanolobus sp.]|uniref:type II toxin-antitoxin system HicB family antitoxin n=1 Tax=uncultured Methanolobus sp. TaxID=218300 RepID=UPI002AAAD395|nr:type II toxin-antitoxin system HicB family antitoxin [uncultured Methanolobus sp.]
MRFKVILEEDEEVGGYIVSCSGLPGCISQGETIEEALENIKEAIQACLESLAEDELETCMVNPSSKIVEVIA